MEKGSSEFCCCDGCSQLATIWDAAGVLTVKEANVWRRLCCACVPQWAEVIVTGPTLDSASAMYRLYCSTSVGLGSTQPLYRHATSNGKFLIDGELVDLTFHFIVTETECRFCIRSTALGITEETPYACKLIDAAARAEPNAFCKTLSTGGLGYTQFDVLGYQIRIQKADHVPIRGRQHCVSPEGITVFDTHPIRDLCCNCNCICNCMCLTVATPSGGSVAEVACLYNNGWSFASGIRIELWRPDSGLEKDRIACWQLDETGGTRTDSQGTHHLADTTASVSSTTGKLTNAARFNGSNWLQTADSMNLSLSSINATIALWVRFTSLGQTMTILSKNLGDSATGFCWKIAYDHVSEQIVFSVSDGTSIYSVASTAEITTSQWFFVAVTIDEDISEIGIRVGAGSFETASYSGVLPLTSSLVMMGRQNNEEDPEFLIGDVDQAAIWKKAFGNDSISTVYNDGLGRTCNVDNRCYLRVSSVGTFDVYSLPSPVLLDKVTNPCPRPTANFEMMRKPAGGFPALPLFLALRCVSPEESCVVEVVSCCANGRTSFPSSLTAMVSTGCAACSNFSVALVYKYILASWEGTALMCGHLVTIRIACDFKSLYFDGTPCVGTFANDPTATCDPIYAQFTGTFGGIGCCGPTEPLVNPTISVTVIE